MRSGVLCALRSAGEAQLVAAIDAPRTGLQVVRRCADLPEAVALAIAGLGRVVVLESGLTGVDRAALTRLREAGCGIVLLVPTDDLARGRALGADVVLALDAPAEDVVSAIHACVRAADGPRKDPPADGAGGRGADRTAVATGPGPAEPVALAGRARGRLVAVWGPQGAPGRTTLAVNLAAELAALGEQTLLVDADTWGGSVAQTLGLLDESPGIAAAARAAENGVLDVPALSRLCPVVEPGLRVLTGLTRPDRWRELSAAGLEAIWESSRVLADWTVVDCGFSLEDEAGSGFEAMLGPRRNASTCAALAAADVVLVVGAAEPVGMQRLVQGLSDLSERKLATQATLRVVVNRLRASAAGPMPERAVTEALVRYAGVVDPVLVPDDRHALDRAMLQGVSLRAGAPSSPARLAVQRLALSLVGSSPAERSGRGRTRRRGRRSAVRGGEPSPRLEAAAAGGH